jgi:hypothetical protein
VDTTGSAFYTTDTATKLTPRQEAGKQIAKLTKKLEAADTKIRKALLARENYLKKLASTLVSLDVERTALVQALRDATEILTARPDGLNPKAPIIATKSRIGEN